MRPVVSLLVLTAAFPCVFAAPPSPVRAFLGKHCASCHDSVEKKGDLDLDALAFRPADPGNHDFWVKLHDRVADGEMPPAKKPRPDAAELEAFLGGLSSELVAAERARLSAEGRATRRRLNRLEYENAVRDLLDAPWLQVKEWLPEDGEAFRFNKVGEALERLDWRERFIIEQY